MAVPHDPEHCYARDHRSDCIPQNADNAIEMERDGSGEEDREPSNPDTWQLPMVEKERHATNQHDRPCDVDADVSPSQAIYRQWRHAASNDER